jgi:aryl-alcohol dehydrogenase-like predicted oxidoreductase
LTGCSSATRSTATSDDNKVPQKEPVTAPIVGATTIAHLEAAVGALSVQLTQDEAAYLEEPYVPHRVVGHQ